MARIAPGLILIFSWSAPTFSAPVNIKLSAVCSSTLESSEHPASLHPMSADMDRGELYDFNRLPFSLQKMGATPDTIARLELRLALTELLDQGRIKLAYKPICERVARGSIKDPFASAETEAYLDFFRAAVQHSRLVERLRLEAAVLRESPERFMYSEVVLPEKSRVKELPQIDLATFMTSSLINDLERIAPAMRLKAFLRIAHGIPPLLLDESVRIVALFSEKEWERAARALRTLRFEDLYPKWDYSFAPAGVYRAVDSGEMPRAGKPWRELYPRIRRRAAAAGLAAGLVFAAPSLYGQVTQYRSDRAAQQDAKRSAFIERYKQGVPIAELTAGIGSDERATVSYPVLMPVLKVADAVWMISQAESQEQAFAMTQQFLDLHRRDLSVPELIRIVEAARVSSEAAIRSPYQSSIPAELLAVNSGYLDGFLKNIAVQRDTLTKEDLLALAAAARQSEVKKSFLEQAGVSDPSGH